MTMIALGGVIEASLFVEASFIIGWIHWYFWPSSRSRKTLRISSNALLVQFSRYRKSCSSSDGDQSNPCKVYVNYGIYENSGYRIVLILVAMISYTPTSVLKADPHSVTTRDDIW